MDADFIDYTEMVEAALRGVVREALRTVEQKGLVSDHHFYIAFDTGCPGVELSDHLRARYPDEMTIVLQHQFWGLEVEDQGFQVTLSFAGANERLRIPFEAVTGFTDPSVRFGLQFGAEQEASASDAGAPAAAGAPARETPRGEERFRVGNAAEVSNEAGAKRGTAGAGKEPEDRGEDPKVVTLDAFRGKK